MPLMRRKGDWIMKKNNIFWGVILLLAGVYIIANSLGFMPDVNIVRLVAGVLCIVVFIRSLVHIEFGGMLFSLAILIILFNRELHLSAITPWPVLVAALLGSIGLDMIFGGYKKTHWKNKKEPSVVNGEYVSGNEVTIRCLFNGMKKNISSDNFTKAHIFCKFGGLEVSFDDAVIQNGTAIVNLDVNFGGVEIYVPHSWHIINNTDCIFGGFDEHRRSAGNGEEGPMLVFEGHVRFGGVDIYRI